MSTKTHSVRASDLVNDWWLIDAEGKTLGRLATKIVTLLLGKGKPTYAPHLEGGDHVIVVNARNVHVTGSKLANKKYYRHSGYPGGIKQRTFNEQMERNPAVVLRQAVKGMLPKNCLLYTSDAADE